MERSDFRERPMRAALVVVRKSRRLMADVFPVLVVEADQDLVVELAYIECAQACGLALLGGPPTVQTALAAHSRGVGQLMAAAVRAGAVRIVVGLGGSGAAPTAAAA